MSASTGQDRFTVLDYMSLPEGFPAELIDGGFVKEPAPARSHQAVVARLVRRLQDAVGMDRVLFAPLDVVVDDWNVLQPDVAVFRPAYRAEARPDETPLVVFEVLSPSTAQRDRGVKCAAYLRAGVEEVWLVDPDAGSLELRTPGSAHTFRGAEEAASAALSDFRVSWESLAG